MNKRTLIIIDPAAQHNEYFEVFADEATNRLELGENGYIPLPLIRHEEALNHLTAEKVVVVLSSFTLDFIAASNFARSIKKVAPHAYIIGLSGTPEHFDEEAFDLLLARNFEYITNLDFVINIFKTVFSEAEPLT